MVEAPTKIIKPLVVDLPETAFDRERTDRLDEAETGKIVAGTGFLEEPCHRLCAVFWVIIFDERTRIDEGVRHLEALIAFCNDDVGHGPGNGGERLSNVL